MNKEQLLKEVSQIRDINILQSIKNEIEHRIECLVDIIFKVNDEVKLTTKYQSRKPYDTVGVIKKINPKKLQVHFANYGTWNIPKTMLMKTN